MVNGWIFFWKRTCRTSYSYQYQTANEHKNSSYVEEKKCSQVAGNIVISVGMYFHILQKVFFKSGIILQHEWNLVLQSPEMYFYRFNSCNFNFRQANVFSITEKKPCIFTEIPIKHFLRRLKALLMVIQPDWNREQITCEVLSTWSSQQECHFKQDF